MIVEPVQPVVEIIQKSRTETEASPLPTTMIENTRTLHPSHVHTDEVLHQRRHIIVEKLNRIEDRRTIAIAIDGKSIRRRIKKRNRKNISNRATIRRTIDNGTVRQTRRIDTTRRKRKRANDHGLDQGIDDSFFMC